jgi:dienelactone hydrolase
MPTDRLAEPGYAAVAPNLFHRYTSDMLADRSGRVQHLSDPEIVADINATVDFLQSHQAVNEDRIGVTGFCMGGRVTWLAAASNPYFKAAAPYYGGNINVIWGGGENPPFDLSEGIKYPVLFHFGEKDINPSAEDMAKFDAELTRLGVEHTFHTYSDADHAFMAYLARFDGASGRYRLNNQDNIHLLYKHSLERGWISRDPIATLACPRFLDITSMSRPISLAYLSSLDLT